MGKKCSYVLFSSCIMFFIAFSYSAAEEFFIAHLNVVRPDAGSESVKKEDSIKLSLLFQQELLNLSSPAVTYRPLESLPKEKLSVVQAKTIITTLDALAVCFFTDVRFLIYGTLNILENGTYETSLHLYSKDDSKVIYEFSHTGPPGDGKTYWAGVAAKLHNYIQTLIQTSTLKPESPEVKDTQTEQVVIADPPLQDSDQEAAKVVKADDPLLEETDTGLITTAETDLRLKAQTRPEDNNKPLLIYLSAGYYFPILDEWKEKTIPCISIEQGVKFPSPWVETEKFDLIFQLGFLFNYSFALNEPDNPYYTHFHSLTGKVALELDFEISNVFSFFIGTGPQYKFNIIDYINYGNHFFTDIPYAFGIYGSTGFQFLIGKYKTMAIGITNILDITFFANLYVDYKAHLHYLLRV